MSDKLEKQNLPVLSPDGSFNTYLQKIRKFPMLDAAEEYILAKNWRDKGDNVILFYFNRLISHNFIIDFKQT